ncbi:hypothetical protein B0T20DRAFT_466484 [Sordaria brevicollis]|uniref:Uncharacterized protein n=1 Tax=Sordaria brevicollis TaxID=83679 RepID=A0AAE0UF16_SORBR|nr:hypothetical protein B0T20DRAFT_466484 [Sordaria brevicollis]
MSDGTWEHYAAQIDLKPVAALENFNRNLVRNELEDELEREREAQIKRWRLSKKAQSDTNKKKSHELPKTIHGQRRKRDDDSDDEVDEEIAERAPKRRNISIDGEQRPPLPISPSTLTSDQINAPNQSKAHKSFQPASRPIFAHRIRTPDSYNPTWLQMIYDQVYHRTYDRIYDEAYSQAYNLAYNDAFKDAMGEGGADGCHDGANRGYEDGYREGYKEAYRYYYEEKQHEYHYFAKGQRVGYGDGEDWGGGDEWEDKEAIDEKEYCD